jgi:hypothetical protein
MSYLNKERKEGRKEGRGLAQASVKMKDPKPLRILSVEEASEHFSTRSLAAPLLFF